jgi:hypothetical protein
MSHMRRRIHVQHCVFLEARDVMPDTHEEEDTCLT